MCVKQTYSHANRKAGPFWDRLLSCCFLLFFGQQQYCLPCFSVFRCTPGAASLQSLPVRFTGTSPAHSRYIRRMSQLATRLRRAQYSASSSALQRTTERPGICGLCLAMYFKDWQKCAGAWEELERSLGEVWKKLGRSFAKALPIKQKPALCEYRLLLCKRPMWNI